jgi:hypothetical protein
MVSKNKHQEAKRQGTVYFMKWLSRLDRLVKKASDMRSQVSKPSMLCQGPLEGAFQYLEIVTLFPHMTASPEPFADFVL